jgi:hypothetical protein
MAPTKKHWRERKVKKQYAQKELQTQYVPAVIDAFSEITSLTRRFPIAPQDSPSEICGIAYRVGWIGQRGQNRMLYRLRLSTRVASYGKATLHGFFVLENGIFVEYVPPDHAGQPLDE